MTPLAHGRHVLAAIVPATTIAMLLGACAGEKRMQPAVPSASRAELLGSTNAQPTAPNTPTASNVVISGEILRACNIPDADAYFAFDSSQLTAFDHAPLDQLAACFIGGPMAGRSLRLLGHADPRGTDDYNMALGQSRADGVASYLTGKGLGRTQTTTTSRGALDATGHEETGWAHDRRVDVLLGR